MSRDELPAQAPASYRADVYEGVEWIPADSMQALDGRHEGMRVKFTKVWAAQRGAVHLFLDTEAAFRLWEDLGRTLHREAPLGFLSSQLRQRGGMREETEQ